jgi:hypothetical protein
MARWTERDIVDQSGRRVVVTGANSGLGFHTARNLALRGAEVVLGCRDAERGSKAIERILAEAPDAQVHLMLLDLADLESVERFSEDFTARFDRLDVLVNNAGVMALPSRATTPQGFEMQLGTNHLGHFALTGRLFGALLSAPASRVVSVSSTMHKTGAIRFDDLQVTRDYTPYGAYSQSKLANLLFVFELDRRAKAAGFDLIGVGAHPGYSSTNLQISGPQTGGMGIQARLLALVTKVAAQSDERGALPILYAAVGPEVKGGDYFGPNGIGEVRGFPKQVAPSRRALDESAAGWLWEESESLTGVTFPHL